MEKRRNATRLQGDPCKAVSAVQRVHGRPIWFDCIDKEKILKKYLNQILEIDMKYLKIMLHSSMKWNKNIK